MRLIAILILVLSAFPVFAHEYWFEPDSFFLKPGDKTPVHLFVGDGLVKDREERVYQPEKTVMFELFGLTKTWDLKKSTIEGAMPVYTFSADKQGSYLLAMERNWTYIKLEPDKFDEYLRSDGMEYIIAERAKLGENQKEGRERYSRFIKGLLQVGDKRDSTFGRKLGFKLELIPMTNPYLKKVGDQIQFQVLFDGKPLAGRTVFADNRESETQKLVTDKRGKFTIKIGKSGLWLARLVYMQRCKSACGEADWESFWAAYSFGVE